MGGHGIPEFIKPNVYWIYDTYIPNLNPNNIEQNEINGHYDIILITSSG